ncbi:MAG: hypothetical protein H6836_05515 [Planctomycetes bacterium]|nr:hypothetical protein [Planctomycetota bacterium]
MTSLCRAAALGVLGAVCSLSGCIASNVVADQDRRVVDPVGTLRFAPATQRQIPGLFESVEIRGAAAASLWKVYYLFEDTGRYAAAALVATEQGMKFQVLDGTWRLEPEGLVLDDTEPSPVDVAPDHLRLRSARGVVVLRRSVLR